MSKLPTGVEIRGRYIRIWFMFRGKRCRETLKGWEITNSNIKKAGNLRALIAHEINSGEFEYLRRFPQSSTGAKMVTTRVIKTFGELCNIWTKIKETELTTNTMKKTKSQLKTLRIIICESTPISHIRYSDILNYRNELLHGETLYLDNPRSNKKGRTVRTVDNYIALLCSLLRFAYQSGFISTKPFEGVKKLQRNRIKPDPLSKTEFNALMESEKGQSQNMWKFAVYSGLRHGELAALAWEDVDLEKGIVNVRRNLTILDMFGPPKTNAGIRTVTLLQPALEALKEQYKLTGHHRKSEITFYHREYGRTEKQKLHFVFMPRVCNGKQKPYYSVSSLGARWNAAVKRAGIRRRNPYHTRHTFACWLLTAGANPAFIASQMGHETAQMVYEIYGMWIDDMNDEQIAMLNARLS